MTFLNPLALLLLLSLPLLILLYFLKLKRPQIRVASTLLWQKVLEDMRVNSPFQKLKRSLLMLLQLLALLAIIFALARPMLKVRDDTNESIIVLLDTSASMGAVEPAGKTRLQLAKKEITTIADNLANNAEIMLITFNSRAKLLSSFSDNHRTLRSVLAAIETTDCPTVIEPALLLAKSIAAARNQPRIVIFSDGSFSAPPRIEMPVPLDYVKIGTSLPNVAVTGLDIRRSLRDRDRIEMFVAMENISDTPCTGNMTVKLDDRILDSKYVSIKARESLSQIFEASLPAGGNISVTLDVDDALACDNTAWKIVPPPQWQRVLAVTDNPFFLKRAFRAAQSVRFDSVSPSELLPDSTDGYSTIIWANVPAPAAPPCNNIYLDCAPTLDGLTLGQTINAPDILDWDNTHPANRFIDYDNLVISATTTLTLPEFSATLLSSTHTPLITMIDHPGGSLCIVGFDPIKSNWPLLVSFPLFLNNCLAYFDQQTATRQESNILVGQPITAPRTATRATITTPDTKRHKMKKTASGIFSYSDVVRIGIYLVDTGDLNPRSVAVNLFDRHESSLDVSEEPDIPGATVASSSARKSVNREYWRFAAIFFAFALLLEWFIYHRRIFT